MTEKRFEVIMNEYDEVEYIMDKIAMEDRDFADFMDFVEDMAKENEQLKTTIEELELENAKHIGEGEWDIRDITYGHGKFRLEEWGERYHQFYDGDKPLEDEEVVSLLFENEQLKQDSEKYRKLTIQFDNRNKELIEANEQLKKEKQELEERNQKQYKRLYELWELIFNRDWKTLEEKAVEFEENEKLLETEHKATDIHIFYMIGDD